MLLIVKINKSVILSILGGFVVFVIDVLDGSFNRVLFIRLGVKFLLFDLVLGYIMLVY